MTQSFRHGWHGYLVLLHHVNVTCLLIRYDNKPQCITKYLLRNLSHRCCGVRVTCRLSWDQRLYWRIIPFPWVSCWKNNPLRRMVLWIRHLCLNAIYSLSQVRRWHEFGHYRKQAAGLQYMQSFSKPKLSASLLIHLVSLNMVKCVRLHSLHFYWFYCWHGEIKVVISCVYLPQSICGSGSNLQVFQYGFTATAHSTSWSLVFLFQVGPEIPNAE